MPVTWCGRDDLFREATLRLLPVDVALDIGCGILPQRLVRPRVHVCCEPFAQYLEILREKIGAERDRSWILLKATWDQALDILGEDSVDTVFLIDIVEHLEKEEAARLLERTERIARRQVVIFTPVGFMPQCHPDGKDAWGLDGGAWQEHKSGWEPEDFGEGWEVVAARDFHLVDNMGQPLATPFGAMFAIKTRKEARTGASMLRAEGIAHGVVGRFFRVLGRVRGK